MHGIDSEPSIDSTRVTTQKNVFIASGQRMLKVDKVDNRPILDKTLEQMKASLSSSDAEAFIFSDFRHGVFSRSTIPQLTASLPEGKLRVADSQVASRWGNILDFQGFDLITPNEREGSICPGRPGLCDKASIPGALQKGPVQDLDIKAGRPGHDDLPRPKLQYWVLFWHRQLRWKCRRSGWRRRRSSGLRNPFSRCNEVSSRRLNPRNYGCRRRLRARGQHPGRPSGRPQ